MMKTSTNTIISAEAGEMHIIIIIHVDNSSAKERLLLRFISQWEGRRVFCVLSTV